MAGLLPTLPRPVLNRIPLKLLLRQFALGAMLVAGWTTHASAQSAAEPYQWNSVAIVAGGYVPGIIFSSAQKNLVYCRTDIGSAYRWDAVNQQWIPLTDFLGPTNWNFMGCESIAPDPRDPNKLYLAGGMYLSGNAAILRSNDGGKSFQITAVPFKMGGNEEGRGVGERLNVDPGDTRVLYFGSRHDGLWKSEDAGVAWKKVASFPFAGSGSSGQNGRSSFSAGIAFVLFEAGNGQERSPTKSIYVGIADTSEAHLYHSSDAGVTWAAMAGQPPDLLPHHAAIDGEGNLYVAYSNIVGPNTPQGTTISGAVWKLETRTGQWTDISPVLMGGPGGFSDLSVDRQHAGTLAVSTLDHWNPGDDLLRSTDGGKTWKSVSPTAQLDATLSPYLFWGRSTVRFGWWITALAIDPFDANHVLYGTGATIWGTHDMADLDRGQPTHWSVAAKGIEETAVLDLISPSVGAHLISAVGDIGGFRHDDLTRSPLSGMSKDPVFTNTYTLDFAELKPEIMVRTGTVNNAPAFSYSEDGGTTWKPLTIPTGAPAGGRRGGNNGGQARDVVVVSADGRTFVSTRGTPSISTDRGQTWSPSTGLRAGMRPVADRQNGKKFYSLDTGNAALLESTDAGATFTSQPMAGLPTGVGVRGGNGGGGAKLWATPGFEGDLWVVTGRRLYHSTDGGKHFTEAANSAVVYTIGFGKAPPGKNYPALFMTGNVDSTAGIFRSDDAGASWVRINDEQHQYGNYPTVVIGDPRIYGRVYIGTNGRGILYADKTPAN